MSLCDEGLCFFASSDFLSLGEPKSSKVRKAFKKSQKKVRKPNHPSQPKAQRRGSKKPSDTGDSRAIPQPSTNPAQHCLSSMF